MERLKSILFFMIFVVFGCNQTQKLDVSIGLKEAKKNTTELKKALTDEGFQIFDYVDEETKDTVLM